MKNRLLLIIILFALVFYTMLVEWWYWMLTGRNTKINNYLDDKLAEKYRQLPKEESSA